MATLDQSQHKSSVVRYDRLMQYRKAMMDNDKDLARLDLDIANAFEPESSEEIDKRLDRVKELSAIRKEMIAMKLNMVNFRGSVSRIFSSEGYITYDDDMARWKELKEIREQMVELHIDTTVIDKRIMNVFEAPTLTQPSSPYLATPAQSPSAVLPLRKRVACAELEPASGMKRQAVGQNGLAIPVLKAKKPDFWALGKDSNWVIGVQTVCMGDAFYHVGPEHMASLQPDTKTETIQVYRSQPQSYLFHASQSWIPATKLHSALFFSPKSVCKVVKAVGSAKAHIILRDDKGDEGFIDFTFLEYSGVLEFVRKLGEVGDVSVEEIERTRMNGMFANNRLRKKKVLI